jgi:hypothetical protein
MDIEVELVSSQYTIEFTTPSIQEVQPTTTEIMRIQDLVDFDDSNTNDKYVMVYDSSQQKFKMVNPDEVLNYAAGEETIQPGLVGYASTFLERLDVDLDDKIDLDAGTF